MANDVENDEQSLSQPISPARDNHFVRLSADVSFCVNLAHGVEIALLQRTSAYKDIIMNGGQPVKAVQGNILVDVARIRMDDDDAVALAYNILLEIGESGIVELTGFEKNVSVIRKAIKDSAKRRSK